MKIKIPQTLIATYFLLIFILLKKFNIFSIIFFIIVILIDYFADIRNGIKNLLYFLAALSVFTPIFYIFLLYLPFTVFGLLLQERNFVRNYMLGFAVSFIPSISIYLISTYLSLPLSFTAIAIIFYLLPIIAIIASKKKVLSALEMGTKDFILALIVLFCTILVAINIVDDKNLFIANGSREFYRVQNAVNGLANNGLIPIYDPGVGSGEATYLWVPPAVITHFALANLFLKFMHPILFFNANSLFILLLFALSLSILFYSIINKRSNLDIIAVAAVTVITGLNFFILQSLESIRAFFGFPISNLLFSIVLNNPKRFKDFVVLMYLSALILTIHSSFGLAVVLFTACLFIFTKLYYFRNQNEIRYFMKWAFANKLKLLITLIIMALLPLFYVATPIIFKDFLLEVPSAKLNFGNMAHAIFSFFRDFYHNELSYLSLRYPDVNRIDDHKFGFFLSVFGALIFIPLILMYKIKDTQNFRIFASSFILHLIILSIISIIAIRVGGFFRTPPLYLLILLGASILMLIFLVNKKIIQIILIIIVSGAFVHALPSSQQNISNIHKEQFMSGEVYKNEIHFIKQLPIDGRIMTYGMFNSVIDYGISYFTKRYGSRNENTALQVARTPHEKIHGQNSFGEPDMILTKSSVEIYNYLRAGGYNYLFINIGHPIGAYVASQIYPNFSYAIYQNGPLVFLIVNNTNYAEKVDLVKSLDENIYKERDGYKYTTISKYYDFKYDKINYKEVPREPEPLKFERLSATRVKISGNFTDGELVVFKDQYFSRWRAHMNSKEIPVYANNHELILLRTVKGDSIMLEYSVLGIERFVGVSSLIGFLGFSVFLVFLLRQHDTVDKIQNNF